MRKILKFKFLFKGTIYEKMPLSNEEMDELNLDQGVSLLIFSVKNNCINNVYFLLFV